MALIVGERDSNPSSFSGGSRASSGITGISFFFSDSHCRFASMFSTWPQNTAHARQDSSHIDSNT
jgi:hypothetical protein